jgi:uncharacterized protein
MELMTRLLREGRAPAELMATYAAEDGQRARNGPCSCGSGKKWKKCHGLPVSAQGL